MTSIDNLSMQVDKFMFIDVIFFIFDDKFMTSIDNLSFIDDEFMFYVDDLSINVVRISIIGRKKMIIRR